VFLDRRRLGDTPIEVRADDAADGRLYARAAIWGRSERRSKSPKLTFQLSAVGFLRNL